MVDQLDLHPEDLQQVRESIESFWAKKDEALKAAEQVIKDETGPTWSEVRDRMNEVQKRRGVLGGAPMPMVGIELVIEPRYPNQGLNGFAFDEEYDLDNPDELIKALAHHLLPLLEDRLPKIEELNQWFSFARQVTVTVYRERYKDGACSGSKVSTYPAAADRYMMFADTLQVAAHVWSLDAELKAQSKLREMISDQQWKTYVLAGAFAETSKRSLVTYIFRKGKPTVAIGTLKSGMRSPLCTLCMHGIGYYARTHAGCLVPSDEVISHLLFVRGDEHCYWRQANQTPVYYPQSGI